MPPYTSETETTCEFKARDCRITAVVAEPELNARAYFAPSRAAMQSSKLVRFGLEDLEYSCTPMGWCTLDCAKVVDREIWDARGQRLYKVLVGRMLMMKTTRSMAE